MRTLTANIGLLAGTQTSGTASSSWNSMVAGVRDRYVAAMAQLQTANLPAYLLNDAFGEAAPVRAESHVRDGFGRRVY